MVKGCRPGTIYPFASYLSAFTSFLDFSGQTPCKAFVKLNLHNNSEVITMTLQFVHKENEP